MGELQRLVEEDTRHHETQLSEMRVKHSAAIDSLQEQLDNAKRVSVCFCWSVKCCCVIKVVYIYAHTV